jgi:hypothetical protein
LLCTIGPILAFLWFYNLVGYQVLWVCLEWKKGSSVERGPCKITLKEGFAKTLEEDFAHIVLMQREHLLYILNLTKLHLKCSFLD